MWGHPTWPTVVTVHWKHVSSAHICSTLCCLVVPCPPCCDGHGLGFVTTFRVAPVYLPATRAFSCFQLPERRTDEWKWPGRFHLYVCACACVCVCVCVCGGGHSFLSGSIAFACLLSAERGQGFSYLPLCAAGCRIREITAKTKFAK
jgi:hypothetical protein